MSKTVTLPPNSQHLRQLHSEYRRTADHAEAIKEALANVIAAREALKLLDSDDSLRVTIKIEKTPATTFSRPIKEESLVFELEDVGITDCTLLTSIIQHVYDDAATQFSTYREMAKECIDAADKIINDNQENDQ
jgi:hypothetical protein